MFAVSTSITIYLFLAPKARRLILEGGEVGDRGGRNGDEDHQPAHSNRKENARTDDSGQAYQGCYQPGDDHGDEGKYETDEEGEYGFEDNRQQEEDEDGECVVGEGEFEEGDEGRYYEDYMECTMTIMPMTNLEYQEGAEDEACKPFLGDVSASSGESNGSGCVTVRGFVRRATTCAARSYRSNGN